MPNLDELIAIRKKLKATEVTITLPSGDVITEKRSENGDLVKIDKSINKNVISNKRRKKVEYLKKCGFVVDLEPDLSIGVALSDLLFGSQDVAADFQLLKSQKISCILNVGTGIPNFFPEQFEYLKIDILDLPETNILNYFDQIFPWIDAARNSKKKVFVHCNAGISRSATIVVAYLMRTKQLSAHQAIETCKKTRYICPNSGFFEQLIKYESILNIS